MTMIQAYILALFLLFIVVLLYHFLGSVHFEEADRLRLERANLNLQTIIRVLEAPDTRHLLEDPETRVYVFREYADSLRKDVWNLIRSGQLGLSSLALAGLFFSAFYLLRLKASFHCRPADLMILGRLELVIVRSLAAS